MCERSAYIVKILSISTCFKFDRFQFFFSVRLSPLLFSGAHNKKPLTKNNKINSETTPKTDEKRENPDYFYLSASFTRSTSSNWPHFFYVFFVVHCPFSFWSHGVRVSTRKIENKKSSRGFYVAVHSVVGHRFFSMRQKFVRISNQ